MIIKYDIMYIVKEREVIYMTYYFLINMEIVSQKSDLLLKKKQKPTVKQSVQDHFAPTNLKKCLTIYKKYAIINI